MENKVLIIGAGHLAARLKVLVEEKGLSCVYIADPKQGITDLNGSGFEQISTTFKAIDLSNYQMIYLLDDSDEQNLEYIIALMGLGVKTPVAASLFNENLIPHLQAAYSNLRILNPAREAAGYFTDALYAPVDRQLRYTPVPKPDELIPNNADNLLWQVLGAFSSLIIFAVAYFHITEKLRWIDALYFVIVTVTGVGYGDITLLHSSDMNKVFNIVLIVSATISIWLIFSLAIDRIIKKRIQLSLGQRKYDYKDHVVVCGLGRLGYCVVEILMQKGEKVVAIEMEEDSDKVNQLRQRGANIYTGNARSFAVLENVNITQAKAVISVMDNDYYNLEVGLKARSLRPDMRLILRIFDENMARQLRDDLDIHLTLSMSALADDKFLELLQVNQSLVASATTAATGTATTIAAAATA